MTNLLISEPPLQVLPTLATIVGLNEAIFAQQLHYFLLRSGTERDGRLWIYHTYDDWGKVFPFWSVPTIRRIVKSLKSQEVIATTSEYNRMPIDKTLWYTLDYSRLSILAVDVINVITRSDHIDHMLCDHIDHTNNNREEEKEEKKERATVLSLEEVLALWGELFPNKPQPRKTNRSLKTKLRTRLKNADFVEQWRDALRAASESATLHKESWFNLSFFLKNDENFEKCLDRWMSWKDERLEKQIEKQSASEFETLWDNEAVPYLDGVLDFDRLSLTSQEALRKMNGVTDKARASDMPHIRRQFVALARVV